MTHLSRNQREQKALEIAARLKITRGNDGKWTVPAQYGGRSYKVDPNPPKHPAKPSCTCPDHRDMGHKCKHILAVEYTLNPDMAPKLKAMLETGRPGMEPRKQRAFPRDWATYNAAQAREMLEFLPILHDLCQTIPERQPKRGRPPTPYSEAVFATALKIYSTKSARRAGSYFDLACGEGYLERPVCPSTIWSTLEDPALSPILRSLIVLSSKPLAAVETIFAVDSSNFGGRWYVSGTDIKYRGVREANWSKLHLMCGVSTNIVTDAIILDRDAPDLRQLPTLLNTTAETFEIKEVLADTIYNTVENQQIIAAHGAVGYIPFKTSHTGASGGVFRKAFNYYKYRREEFLVHYHQRSNVESTMSMIKAKFGHNVRSRTDVAMANETYCKVICHNICRLIHSIYELQIEAEVLGKALKKEAAD